MVFEEKENGILLRVRLTPNAAAAGVKGIFTDADGNDYLKIAVVSVPEKGRANRELIMLIAKTFKIAKSEIELVSGEISHYKKILITGNRENIRMRMESWSREK